jgi:hypothetical protein
MDGKYYKICDVCLQAPAATLAIFSSGARTEEGDVLYDLAADVCKPCSCDPDVVRLVAELKAAVRKASR